MVSMPSKTRHADFIYVVIYLLTWLSGIIFFFLSGNDKRKKRHSIQAIMLGILGIIIAFIPYINFPFNIILWLYGLYVGYMASINEDVSIPVITDLAKKYA